MNNAHSGEGTLIRLMLGVPLQCSQVVTYANMYVDNKAPFYLVLGPWQCGDFVSTDEHVDGIYLVFKDSKFQQQYKMTVEGDPEPNQHS